MKFYRALFFLISLIMPLSALDYNEPLWVEANGHTLWSESFGQWSDKKAIILIAGMGANARFWPDPFCQSLVEEGFFVIRYDHRDVGLSSGCPDGFEIEELADDVVAILDAYQIPKAHVAGLSMGGMIAQFVSAKYPARVMTQTLIATAPIGATSKLDFPMSMAETIAMANTLCFLGTHRLNQDYLESYPVLIERYRFFNGEYPLDEPLLDTYLWNMYHRSEHPIQEGTDDVHFQSVQRLMGSLNKRRMIFKKMEAPTLIIHGMKDNLILISRGGAALHEAIQGSCFKIYPKMGHGFFNRDLLNQLASDMLDFFSKIPLKY